MKEYLLKKIVENVDYFTETEEINELSYKTLPEITKTNFKDDTEFYNFYDMFYLEMRHFLKIDFLLIKILKNPKIFSHKIGYYILQTSKILISLLFILTIIIPFYTKNYWLLLFIFTFYKTNSIGYVNYYDPNRKLYITLFVIGLVLCYIFDKDDIMKIMLIQIFSAVVAYFSYKYYLNFIIKIVKSDKLAEKFLWKVGFIYFKNEKENKELLSYYDASNLFKTIHKII